MRKFKNKYRIPSARLKNWDYGADGSYFITINTKKGKHFFGKVVNGEMILNKAGLIAHQIWSEIPDQFPFAELGNFIIMPNHTHGILIIDKNAKGEGEGEEEEVQTRFIASPAPSEQSAPNKKHGGITGDHNPMMQENIARILRWYKGRCTFEIRKIRPDFAWHVRYHDHIIRTEKSFENIQNYIENNPANWDKDKFFGPPPPDAE
jgi:putative transposase